jgi:hypothetical protein
MITLIKLLGPLLVGFLPHTLQPHYAFHQTFKSLFKFERHSFLAWPAPPPPYWRSGWGAAGTGEKLARMGGIELEPCVWLAYCYRRGHPGNDSDRL